MTTHKKTTLVFFLVSLLLNSCSNILCGNFDEKWNGMVIAANNMYPGKISVRSIPCEFHAINTYSKTPIIDTAEFRKVHQLLYNAEEKIGWPRMMVHDINGKYVFSLNLEGKTFIQTGD